MKRRSIAYLAGSYVLAFLPLSGIVAATTEDIPEIQDVNLETTELSNSDYELEVTIAATSESPVDWVSRRFEGPTDTIFGGGGTRTFTQIEDGVWETSRTYTVSKWAPDGVYSFENIQVRNEAMQESAIWQHEVKTTIETAFEADPPELEDVALEATIQEDSSTVLEVTFTASSNAPVNGLSRRFVGPTDTILGGGGSRDFEEIEAGVWEYSREHTISKWAPDGEYAFEDVQVRNEGRLESDPWPEPVSTTITSPYDAEQPEILDVQLTKAVGEDDDTALEFTITATSNAPVDGLSRRFVGPEGTILGGGGSRTFEEIEEEVWEYSREHTISKHAPTGDYAFEDVQVRNEGRIDSAVWPEPVIVTIGEEEDADDSENDPDCFIATAACGTPDHKHVVRLREFRDETLAESYIGSLFIHFYYATSPPIARWIERSERRRRIVRRGVVRPAVHVIELFSQNS